MTLRQATNDSRRGSTRIASFWLRHRFVLSISVAAIFGGALVATVAGLLTDRPHHRVGNVVFSGNSETGDISQWTWGAQCANTGPVGGSAVRGTVNIVEDVVAQGHYAARFDLPAGGPVSACEVLRKRTMALGSDDWYALEVYFPPSWQEPSSQFWGLLFAQFDYEALAGPPVGLYAHADHVNLAVQSGLCAMNSAGIKACQYSSGNDASSQGTLGYTLRIVPLGTQLAGTWQQFVVHVHHAADSSGLVQGWWRPLGRTWAKTVDWSGYPTVQWSSTQPANSNTVTTDKIGAYRGAATFPVSIGQDGYCVATSFGAAESCL